jgi:hypothetical protein
MIETIGKQTGAELYADLLAAVRESSKPATDRHLSCEEWAAKWNLSGKRAGSILTEMKRRGVVDTAKRAGRPVYRLPDEFYEVGNGNGSLALSRR